MPAASCWSFPLDWKSLSWRNLNYWKTWIWQKYYFQILALAALEPKMEYQYWWLRILSVVLSQLSILQLSWYKRIKIIVIADILNKDILRYIVICQEHHLKHNFLAVFFIILSKILKKIKLIPTICAILNRTTLQIWNYPWQLRTDVKFVDQKLGFVIYEQSN